MKTTVLEPETWKRVIEFEIPEDRVNVAVDAKLAEYRREARLPGFRQGKVPLAVVKQRFGDTARALAIEDTVRDSYKAACEEHKIEPVSEAKMTDMKADAGEPLRFTIETEIDPPIEIDGYDKLKVRAKAKKIEDSDVEENYENLLDRFSEFKNVERPAVKGDFVAVKYRKVAIAGKERAEFVNNDPRPIEIGAKGGIKEFDKELTGASAGEIIEVEMNFPEDYADPVAAGKTGLFLMNVLSVQEKQLPEVNEEFLKKLGDFATVDDLKAELRRNLEASEAQKAKKTAHNEAIETLINANPFEVPPSKVDTFVDMMIEDQMQQSNIKSITDEQRALFTEGFKDSAVMALKRIRIVDYIADKEKIKALQEEVDREIEALAQRYGHDFDDLKQMFRKNGTTNRLRAEIRERKTLDFLIGENDK